MSRYKLVSFLLAVLLTAAATLSSLAGEPADGLGTAGDFALLDHQGKFHQLSYYGDQKAVVILAQGAGTKAIEPKFEALSKRYAEQGVVFFKLNAQDTRSNIAQAAPSGSSAPILVDDAQLVTESLGVQREGEVVVIEPGTMALRYRGDFAHLGEALDAVLAGVVDIQSHEATGSLIEFESLAAHRQHGVSYTKDIVPILNENCVSCHHVGGIGSWPMNSHAMLRGWSLMMREVVMTRRMPPGQIDAHVGRPLEEVAGLTASEKQKLVHWIDAGAPFDGGGDGDGTSDGDNGGDPLTALTFDNPKYTLGEPDLVFKVAAQSIPATGIVDYRYIPVELNLDRDVWVRGMEFVPGDPQVLHHVIAYVSAPADKTVKKGRETGSARGESVGGFAPGRQPDAFGDDSGRLIKKGSNLLLQMHYTTSGKATIDETEVALFLHDQPPKYVMAGGVAGQRRFLVPPHAKEHRLEGEQLIERDAYLYSMTPHMHFRGKYMSYTAEFPDGRSEVLLSVPKYDFNWQFSYQLKEPLLLPAGTRLVASGAMDNSDRNPSNPDPSKPVHFGLQTKHEMFFGFTTLRYVGDTPQSVLGQQNGPAAEGASAASNKNADSASGAAGL